MMIDRIEVENVLKEVIELGLSFNGEKVVPLKEEQIVVVWEHS